MVSCGSIRAYFLVASDLRLSSCDANATLQERQMAAADVGAEAMAVVCKRLFGKALALCEPAPFVPHAY